jgi:hypothetical protein
MNNFAFNSISQIQINLPTFSERGSKKWISYGEDNLYPQFIASLFLRSAINRTAIQSKIDATIGNGLKTTDEALNYVLVRANPIDSWNDVFEKCAQDYITFGGYAINVIWSNDGNTISEIYHLDFTKVRSGKIEPGDDAPKEYFYSTNWENSNKYKPTQYATYNPTLSIEQPSQILYAFDYEPGNIYYPLPTYAGSINDIQIDIEVSKFHISNLANSLNPSLFISLNNGIPAPEERKEIYDELTMAYRGTENAGKAFVAFSQDKEHAPEVTPISSTNDNYYTTLETRITTRILTGHRITSPLLLGLYNGGAGFSSNADELAVAYGHFIGTCIRPIQKSMLRVFNNLMLNSGYDTDLYIVPTTIIEPTAIPTTTTSIVE